MAQSPFPGMDPYLEDPNLWRDVHGHLMHIFREQLVPYLLPNYIAKIETEVIIDRAFEDIPQSQQKKVSPDVSIIQTNTSPQNTESANSIALTPYQVTIPIGTPIRIISIHIQHIQNKQLVTVIELLSPANKRKGKGRNDYLDKRNTYLESNIHFIEIDLLRKYDQMPLIGTFPKTPYLALVSNFYNRPTSDIWPITLQDTLPTLPIPLLHPDAPVPLNLQQALNTAYQRARYDSIIDYNQLPPPPLSKKDKTWLKGLLTKAK